MRWKERAVFERRTITRFLWIPCCIGKETRWLEKASIVQTWGGKYCGWQNFEWGKELKNDKNIK